MYVFLFLYSGRYILYYITILQVAHINPLWVSLLVKWSLKYWTLWLDVMTAANSCSHNTLTKVHNICIYLHTTACCDAIWYNKSWQWISSVYVLYCSLLKCKHLWASMRKLVISHQPILDTHNSKEYMYVRCRSML